MAASKKRQEQQEPKEDQNEQNGQKQRELSLEEAFEALEQTVRQLSDEEIPLEDSFRIYQEGMKLLKLCNDKIDKVEKQVLVLNEEGELDEFE